TGTIVAESVTPGYPRALDEVIGDPCFVERYASKYQGGMVTNIPDVYKDPRVTDCYLSMLEQYKVRANLVVPIRQDQNLFGLLIAHQCSGPRKWAESDLKGCSQVATEMEFHLDFIQRFQEQKSSAKQAWFLGDIAFRARQTGSLDDIIQSTLKGLRQILKTDRLMYYQFNPDWSGTMVAESVSSEWPSVLQEKIDDPCFRGSYVELYKSGRVRAISNIRKEQGLTECHIRTLERYDVKANVVAPLRSNGKLIGLLIAHHCVSPREWSKPDINLLTQAALQLEYAMEHLDSIHKIESASERNRLYGDLAFRARQSQDEKNVLNVAIQGALKQLKTNRVMLYRFNDDWSGTMVAEALNSTQWTEILDKKIEDPCFKGKYVDLYRDGRVRAINNILTEPGLTDCHVRTLEQYEVKANLVAPVRLEGKLHALLIAHHCEAPRVWSEGDIDFFGELAIQLEYALDHIRFIQKIEQSRQSAEAASEQQKEQTLLVKNQLTKIKHEIEGAINGNLTVRASSQEGDIGVFAQFLNQAIENLQHIVIQVQESTEAVSGTASLNQSNIDNLSLNSQAQARAIGHSLDVTQEMSHSIQVVADNAQQAKQKVQLADRVLDEGQDAMNLTAEAISDIQTKVDETAQQVKLLGESCQSISRVVQLIQDLANQTNVLALNASIESGLANDKAQGFTIVAEEVRTIADRSKAATGQIEQIVEEIQSATNEVVSTMEEWREEVASGNAQVEQTRQKFSSMALLSKEIRSLVEEIAEAATEQSVSSQSVSTNIQEVKTIAQQNLTHVQQVSDSFQDLVSVAQKLNSSVSQFTAR
ncbi:MAG: GAF domain-containing protein, partial [Cyanobacteria bacterium P01_F01_bin.42]